MDSEWVTRSKTGFTVSSKNKRGQCYGTKATFAEAQSACVEDGAQLCTVEQLQYTASSCNVGCGYENNYAWVRQDDLPTAHTSPAHKSNILEGVEVRLGGIEDLDLDPTDPGFGGIACQPPERLIDRLYLHRKRRVHISCDGRMGRFVTVIIPQKHRTLALAQVRVLGKRPDAPGLRTVSSVTLPDDQSTEPDCFSAHGPISGAMTFPPGPDIWYTNTNVEGASVNYTAPEPEGFEPPQKHFYPLISNGADFDLSGVSEYTIQANLPDAHFN